MICITVNKTYFEKSPTGLFYIGRDRVNMVLPFLIYALIDYYLKLIFYYLSRNRPASFSGAG
ncbi:MAG: hypothetical protein CVU71_09695 [Deltaproteobacteria bacterium HGW-Deltaproteobacteria-6]|nr:MAG: hypothetical protein CVU71_09695 [Deltaproteobacteria bacterium HGW-Deltaproteobacteria-6]